MLGSIAINIIADHLNLFFDLLEMWKSSEQMAFMQHLKLLSVSHSCLPQFIHLFQDVEFQASADKEADSYFRYVFTGHRELAR